ncbi:MAG TPA: hypothetical protein VJA19_09335, partial [Pseudomonas sp.]|nr:hypothetical protein [Pseudomonas sp.]
MALTASLPLALAVIAIGLGLLILIALALRWVRIRRPTRYAVSPVTLPAQASEVDAAVLVAQSGGRVVYANSQARRIFDLDG